MSEQLSSFAVPKAIPCDCCGEPIEYTAFLDVWKEDKLGYVCDICKYRLRIANAWLKHSGMKTCEIQNPDTETRPLK